MSRVHETDIRVRYCETDGMGYLHHSHYANYMEQARTEMLRAQGSTYREVEERGLFLVVVKLESNFVAPARYDDVLTVRTTLERITPARLEHSYEILRDGTVLHRARSVLACVDREGNVQRISEVLPELNDDTP
ncbi:MAG: acyl-CoA thioesterase [Planctomycetaceae bacterium]|nr:acyl-CoA thioesterase [Planctomycetaceae bacterium]